MRALGLKGALFVSFVLSLLATGGCSKEMQYAKSIDGQVVDANTGQPIPGAHVYYLYEGPPIPSLGGHQSSDVCYHASAAVSDAQGKFHIDPWEQQRRYDVDNWEPTGWAYAPGYVPLRLAPKDSVRRKPAPRPNDVFRLVKSVATGDERLEELWLFVRWGCLHGGDSQRGLFPAFKAAFDEAKTVAKTPEEMRRVDLFRSGAATVYVAPNPVSDGGNWEARIREFAEKLK